MAYFKRIITVDQNGNIISCIKTNDPTFVPDETLVALDVTEYENVRNLVANKHLYKVDYNEETGEYTIRNKTQEEIDADIANQPEF